jgi:hypothetical protein
VLSEIVQFTFALLKLLHEFLLKFLTHDCSLKMKMPPDFGG